MAKFGSTLKTLGKGAKRGGVSRIKKKSSLFSKSAKGTRKSIYGAKVKGKNILKGTGKKIGPIRPDLKEGGVRKINRLVETRVQNLIPKLSQKIETKVDSFDPNKFMGKIFDGGLGSLRGFGDSLDGMKGSMQGTVDFLNEATEVANNFITKLAKTKQKKGGGLFGTLIKGIALAGAATLAAPAIAKVALFGGAAVGGSMLWKKGIDFIKGRFKKKKKEKKKEETKAKKAKNNLFRGVLEKFGNTLNFLNPLGKRKEVTKHTQKNIFKSSHDSDLSSGERTDSLTVYDSDKSDQVFTLKIDSKDGKVINGNELQQEILDKKKEHTELRRKVNNRDDETHEEMLETDEMETRLEELESQLEDLMMQEGSGATKSDLVKGKSEQQASGVEGMVQKGEQGEQGKEGKKGGLGGFIQNTTNSVKNVAGNIVKSTPQYKLMQMVKENREKIQKGAVGGAKGMLNELPQVKAAKWMGGKVKGAAGWLGKGLKGMVDSAFGLRKDSAKAIAQPAKGTAGGGEGGIVPIKIEKGKDSKGSAPKPQLVEKDPANKVPALLAMDRRNLHTPYAKSTFNIVDAM